MHTVGENRVFRAQKFRWARVLLFKKKSRISYFCKNSIHATDQKCTRNLVVGFLRLNSRFSTSHLYALGMADLDPAVPDDCFREGHGYHVELLFER